ncbi:MAG: DUF1311 domain-containing protein [Blastocatellia bacterium]|nr:DUF1311 domain-containing protein [Blastocatellia bacterium]
MAEKMIFTVNGFDEAIDLDTALKSCLGKEASFDREVECIDRALETCLDKNPSTGGQVQCATRAYELWDKKLNEVYTELNNKLSKKERMALKSAQLQWLNYRNAEFKFIDSVYSFEKGSMNVSFNVQARLRLVRARVLELHRYSEE